MYDEAEFASVLRPWALRWALRTSDERCAVYLAPDTTVAGAAHGRRLGTMDARELATLLRARVMGASSGNGRCSWPFALLGAYAGRRAST